MSLMAIAEKMLADESGTFAGVDTSILSMTSRPLILLAEDDEANTMVATVLLEMCGFDVDHVTNGTEAVEKAKTGKYLFALLDMRMHNMGGLEATRMIREHEKATGATPLTIVCVTASAARGERERCMAAGMNDYLAKPYEPEEFKFRLTALAQSLQSAL